MFWKKKKAEAPLKFPEPRELTGIEKAAIEERGKECAELERKGREERTKLTARLIELQEKIKPQMDEIHILEMRLYPGQQYLAMQAQLQASYAGYQTGSLGAFGGLLGSQIGRH